MDQKHSKFNFKGVWIDLCYVYASDETWEFIKVIVYFGI